MLLDDILSRAPESELVALTARYQAFLPELVLAFARPQGTNDRLVREALRNQLERHRFEVVELKISDLLQEIASGLSQSSSKSLPLPLRGSRRVLHLMQWGDVLRVNVDPAVAAMIAVVQIAEIRKVKQAAARRHGAAGVAFVIRNLVHPSEVALLRSIYKQRFFLLAIHQPYGERWKQLEERFTRDGDSPDEAKNSALEILQIDAGLRSSTGNFSSGSLNIDNTFHQADVFVQNEAEDAQAVLGRWAAQVFGYPFGSPLPDETGMAFAYLAARQSVALGRSVGAALTGPDGSVIAIGWNEPARPHGGVYREGQKPDARDHVKGRDPSDGNRITALTHFLNQLMFEPWNQDDLAALPEGPREWLIDLRDKVADLEAMDRSSVRSLAAIRDMSSARLLNLIEFGRVVHAEMTVITEAARRGLSTQGAHLFVTTFPCHECARNIVAAGISRVTYVEPYGKSMARELYGDSISFLTSPSSQNAIKPPEGKVVFGPFVGLSPKRFDELFSTLPRKHSLRDVALRPSLEEGARVDWSESSFTLRTSIRGYLTADGMVDPYFEVAKQMAEQSIADRLAAGLAGQLRQADNDDDSTTIQEV